MRCKTFWASGTQNLDDQINRFLLTNNIIIEYFQLVPTTGGYAASILFNYGD